MTIEYGDYILWNSIEIPDDLRKEWANWLDQHFDPGNYDGDIGTYCPPEILKKIKAHSRVH